MQLSSKFLFDRDFDVEKVRQQQLLEDPAVELPPAPMYSEEMLAMARAQAYEQGVSDGLQQADQSQQQILLQLWDRAGHRLAGLIELEIAREQRAMSLAVQSAFHIVKKFWPRLQKITGEKDLETFIADSLAHNNDETRIVLRVNDTQLDTVAAQLPRLKELQGFPGKVITLADDSVLPGDCKMEWADGGSEKLGRHVMQQLEQLLDRLLGHLANPTTMLSSEHHLSDHTTEETSE